MRIKTIFLIKCLTHFFKIRINSMFLINSIIIFGFLALIGHLDYKLNEYLKSRKY